MKFLGLCCFCGMCLFGFLFENPANKQLKNKTNYFKRRDPRHATISQTRHCVIIYSLLNGFPILICQLDSFLFWLLCSCFVTLSEIRAYRSPASNKLIFEEKLKNNIVDNEVVKLAIVCLFLLGLP